ncbi:MAG TPA: LD-carboxypeptidase [Syntrophorhabdaceae bacterium]|nr:LD-carboxypeptidase [Syntrophorhabdaceae bacterium]HNT67833.1 LD-carboxypeptidase [Syntrophorhabdaceae bacterium]
MPQPAKKKIIKPARLREGDRISIVSPASPSMTKIYYEKGRAVLDAMGYHVVPGRHVNDRRLLFAGDAKARAADINDAFRDKSIRAIICVRGGCGTAQILHYIDFPAVARNPKIFVGYSDITCLQTAILQKTGLVTFYGPMVSTDFGKQITGYARESLLNTLTNTGEAVELRNPVKKEMVTIVPGKAEGRLTGGCLSIAVASLGTPYEIDTRGAILFFEDIDEKPHRIDRYLTQLTQAGKLAQARGIIFGTFPQCSYTARDNYSRYGVTLLDIIRERIVPLKIPSIYGLQFGHVRSKLTIPIGAAAWLDATGKRVTVESAVT